MIGIKSNQCNQMLISWAVTYKSKIISCLFLFVTHFFSWFMTNTDQEKTTDAVKYKEGLLDMSDLIWFLSDHTVLETSTMFQLLFPGVYRFLLCSLLHVNLSWTRYEKYASRKSICNSGYSAIELSSCSLSIQNGQKHP